MIAAALTIAWYAGWQSATGSSPGMKLMKLRVTGPGCDGTPTFTAAAIRNAPWILASFCQPDDNVGGAVQLVPVAVYAAIGITIDRSADRQGFHDRLAGGTHVLQQAGKSPPSD